MKTRALCWLVLATLLSTGLSGGLGAATAVAEPAFITIGTGSPSGVYQAVGQAICGMVNARSAAQDIRCTAPVTGGSVFNLEALGRGMLDLAIVQSDWLYHAYRGSALFAARGADPTLRALIQLHAEPFTVVAHPRSGIRRFDDLAGKRVNVGNPGSGQRGTLEVLLTGMGWNLGTFAAALDLEAADQASVLCSGFLDAFVYMVGHPNDSIREAASGCGARLVPVSGPAVDALLASHPYYRPVVIPGGLYYGNPDDTPSFGVSAVLVASTRAGAQTVAGVLGAVFEEIDRFRDQHPALARLTIADMVSDPGGIPLHEAAQTYYHEHGQR